MTRRFVYCATVLMILLTTRETWGEVRLRTDATYRGDNTWRWKVFVAADEERLNEIATVDYILPAEISSERIQTRTNGKERFEVEGHSGGTFRVLAVVTFRDPGKKKQLLEYDLEIATTARREISLKNWASPQPGTQRTSWGIWLDESEEVLSEVERVEYTLHRTFPNRIREATSPETQFELTTNGWGTFPIRVAVYFKDGTSYRTVHALKFRGVPKSRQEWNSRKRENETRETDKVE